MSIRDGIERHDVDFGGVAQDIGDKEVLPSFRLSKEKPCVLLVVCLDVLRLQSRQDGYGLAWLGFGEWCV
jgi:hypothetical protein